jgi:hypothetical protein
LTDLVAVFCIGLIDTFEVRLKTSIPWFDETWIDEKSESDEIYSAFLT